jgi:hypothetical protein
MTPSNSGVLLIQDNTPDSSVGLLLIIVAITPEPISVKSLSIIRCSRCAPGSMLIISPELAESTASLIL